MKRSLIILICLLLGAGFLHAGDYFIGTDTTTQKYVPLYGYVNYNWSKFFFSASEMAASGFTTSQPITKIAFQVGNEITDYVTDNQHMYIRYFYDSEYYSNTDNYPGTASFTHVFSGSVTWNGPGWVEIPLDTPFDYAAGWGIEILWENRDGSRTAGPPYYCYTETSNYTAVQHTGSSSSFPTSDGTRRRDRRPNIWFMTPPTAPPSPVTAANPTDGATDVDINASLVWSPTGGQPTSYRLWFGTDNPPSNLETALLTTQTSYTPDTYLDYSTTYYWKVVPINDFGPALDATVFSFSTKDDPSIAVFPYTEGFDVAAPPENWTDHSGSLVDPINLGADGSSQWGQDDWLNIPSEDKAAKINIWGSISGYLISPLFNVPSDDYVLEFDLAILRYNQPPDGTPPNYSATDDQFAILIGDGFGWSTADIVREYNNTGSPWVLNDIPTSGTHISIPLAGHSGRIKIAFFAGSVDYNDDNDYMINNFRIGLPAEQPGSPIPTLGLDEVSGLPVLNWDAVPQATQYHIYMANDPYGDYQLLDTTGSTSYYPGAANSKAFFKITAE